MVRLWVVVPLSARVTRDARHARVPVMANDEFWGRAADANERFRPVELTDETVTRPAGPQARTVHSFLLHLHDQGLECVPEPLSLETLPAPSVTAALV